MKIDPITLEVIRNKLDFIAEEVQFTLLRSAFSSIVKEGNDASAAIFSQEGETLSQAFTAGGAVHLGAMIPSVSSILKKYPISSLEEGDVIVMNDPYGGGQHLPDVVCVVPVFFKEDVVALVVNLTHHQDMGGKTPGSTPADATEIFQEGLRIPPIKLCQRDKINETFKVMLTSNIRVPDMVWGDIMAQVAAGQTGKRKLLELFEEYGDTLSNYFQELLNRAEIMTRQKIEEIPDGVYQFEDYLDNDGIDLDRRIKIKVAVTIKGSDILVDFEGTDPQVKGPINSVPSVSLAAVCYMTRVITDPTIPNNQGCFRMIDVRCPEGSLLNPRYPAAVSLRAVTLRRIVEVMMGALAKAVPHKITACSNGHPIHMPFGGIDSLTGKSFVSAEMGSGGMGARPNKDGLDCISTETSNFKNIPVEAMESDFPIRILKYSLRPDSGGAGKFRGGLGSEKMYEFLRGEIVATHRGERNYTSPWGLFGGKPGARARTEVMRPDRTIEVVPSKKTLTLKGGDQMRILTTGGGGYGDPLERDPELVLEDVLNGKVTLQAAKEEYGVVIDTGGRDLDRASTTRLRAELMQKHGPVTWIFDRGTELGKE
jgi:N-methylhydantoinase B